MDIVIILFHTVQGRKDMFSLSWFGTALGVDDIL